MTLEALQVLEQCTALLSKLGIESQRQVVRQLTSFVRDTQRQPPPEDPRQTRIPGS